MKGVCITLYLKAFLNRQRSKLVFHLSDEIILGLDENEDEMFEDEGFDIVDTDDLEDFEESIKCVKCTCGGNGFTGLKKRYDGSFLSNLAQSGKNVVTGTIGKVLGGK